MIRKMILVMLGAFVFGTASAAQIDFGDVPATQPVLDSADPFGFGYKFTINGTDYYWTNQPSITIDTASCTDTNAVTKQTTYTVNGKGGALGTNNAVVLTAGDVGAVSQEVDAAALAALASYAATNQVKRLFDIQAPSQYFTTLENGTGTVWQITGPFTNLMVTLSDDFEETLTHTRPAWSTNVFPFTDGNWIGEPGEAYYYLANTVSESLWQLGPPAPSIPAALPPLFVAQGTATVSIAEIYYTTNAVRHFATETELNAARAECGLALTNAINALNPSTVTVYGDLATTNELGQATFLASNPTQATTNLVASAVAGTNSVTFSYPFAGDRLEFARCTAYAQLGGGTTLARSVMTVYDGDDNAVASNVFDAVDAGSGLFQYFTNQVAMTGLNVTQGTIRVVYTLGKSNAAIAHAFVTGGAYPMELTVDTVPINYLTINEAKRGYVATNDTRYLAAITNGSMATFTSLSTTYLYSDRLENHAANVVITLKDNEGIAEYVAPSYPPVVLRYTDLNGNTTFYKNVAVVGQAAHGPSISTKRAFFDTDGTNLWWVNVNSVTNTLTTN